MNYKKLLMAMAVVAVSMLPTKSILAATICSGCEVIDGAAGTYLGLFDPFSFDNGSFNHTDIQADVGQDTPFNDFLLFDLNPGGPGAISADFTRFTAITDFEGALWSDGGSTCAMGGAPGACSSVVPGSELFRVTASDDRWEIITNSLAVGRYIIQVSGTTRASGPSSYAGQLSFAPDAQIPIPSSLALVLLGLLGIGRVSLLRPRK